MKATRVASICLGIMLVLGTANAGIIYVDDDNVAGPWNGTPGKPYQYIQDGIDAAVDGDTVMVRDGVYTGTRNKNLDFNGKAITLTSQNGLESTIIDCEESGRGVYFHSDEGPDSVLNGFTIRNGVYFGPADGYGGGIHCYRSSPTISHNAILNNRAGTSTGGAGICCYESSPFIINNTISGNAPIGIGVGIGIADGGGIYCYSCSHTTISGNTITDNITCSEGSAMGYGGGICLRNCTYTLIADNTITGNNSGQGGGGISCLDSSSTVIINNTISGNTVIWMVMMISTDNVISSEPPSGGGGINCSGSATITGNTITQNNAGAYVNGGGGGGVCCFGTTTVSGNTIQDNEAFEGGGIYCFGSTIILGNTIADNLTSGGNSSSGGGIYCSGGRTTSISGNIITGNMVYGMVGGGGITCDGFTDLGGGVSGSPGLNSIYGNSGCRSNHVYVYDSPTVKAENNWWGEDPPDAAQFAGPIDYDPWLTEQLQVIVNIPPVAFSLLITPTRPLSSDDLTLHYEYFDSDGDIENGTELRWYKDGVLQDIYNDELTVPASATSESQQWHFTVRPRDGQDFGEIYVSPVVRINSPPVASNLRILPEFPLTGDDLQAAYDYSDADDDPESGTEIEWYKNDVPQPAYANTLVIPSSATAKNQWWYFTVRPKDGTAFGDLKASDPVIIQNTPPVASDLSISPEAPLSEDDLVLSYTYSDADGDPENGTQINWYKDDILQTGYEGALIVPSDATTPGDKWHSTVRPNDGTDPGDIQVSPSVIIGRISLTIPATSGSPNGTVEIPVEVNDTTGLGIIAVEFTVTYNPLMLTLDNVTTAGTIAESWGNPTYNITPGQVMLSMAGFTELAGSGPLVFMTFHIAQDAGIGSTSAIAFTSGQLNEGDIPVALRGGLFTVEWTGIYGDVSGNGEVTAYDGALVLQETVGLIQFTPQQEILADVSGNGSVSAYDAALILQYSVGIIDSFPVEDGGVESLQIANMSHPVSVSIPDAVGMPGSDIAVPIVVTDTTGAGIIAVNVILTYDPDILTATGIDTENTITSGWNTIYNISNGQIAIGMISTTELTGAGILVNVNFSVSEDAGVGQSSQLTFAKVIFNEGSPASVTDGLFTVIPAGQWPIDLYEGWNLISLPLQPQPNTDPGSVLSYIDGDYDLVCAYDPETGWSIYVPGGVNDLDKMEAGKGYWIKMNKQRNLIIHGAAPEETAITLTGEAWNLVGYSSTKLRSPEDCMASVADYINSVWEYSPVTSWSVYVPDGPGNLEFMRPGYGYWIEANQGCEWDINAPGSP